MRGQRYHEGMIVELTPGDVRVLLPWLKYSNTAVRDVSPNNTVLAVLQYIDFNLRLGETGISAAAAGTLNTRNPVSRLVGFWLAADGEMYIAISPKTVLQFLGVEPMLAPAWKKFDKKFSKEPRGSYEILA